MNQISDKYTVSEDEYQPISKKALCKRGHFERAKSIFKTLPVSWTEIMLAISPRFFRRDSVGLKGCKVTSCESWSLKKILRSAGVEPNASSPESTSEWFDHLQSLIDYNFAALWPTKTYNTSMERFKPPHSMNSMDKQYFQIGFALSTWPYLHRA